VAGVQAEVAGASPSGITGLALACRRKIGSLLVYRIMHLPAGKWPPSFKNYTPRPGSSGRSPNQREGGSLPVVNNSYAMYLFWWALTELPIELDGNH